MSNGPLATTLTFLSSLPTFPLNSKVRFLGCVTHYALSSGTLTLQHAYPTSTVEKVVALVDVNLLLAGLKREDMQLGAWVNVMGYVEKVIGVKGEGECVKVRVKAVMLWSAGGVKVGEYERILEQRIGG